MAWKIDLISRREVWWPTWKGWLVLLLLLAIVPGFTFWQGEEFLSVTARVPADVLVVEGWIGTQAIAAAADEFRLRRYQYVVASGGYTSVLWGGDRASYAEVARDDLLRAGIPGERIILAQATLSEGQRTFHDAVAVEKVLRDMEAPLKGVNIFTRGPHARRSRLVYRKMLDMPVGVIGWMPERLRNSSWWHSSERAKEFLTEGFGYLFEAVFNSGRLNNQAVGVESKK